MRDEQRGRIAVNQSRSVALTGVIGRPAGVHGLDNLAAVDALRLAAPFGLAITARVSGLTCVASGWLMRRLRRMRGAARS